MLLLSAAVCLGVAAEAVGPLWGQPTLWVTDLLVGLMLTGAGVAALPRSRLVALLLILAALAWFAGTVCPVALFWHRGVLIHLVLSYPTGRPRSAVARVAIVVGYLAALLPWAWQDPSAAAALALGVLLVALWRVHEVGRGHRGRQVRITAGAAGALAAAIIGGEIARAVVSGSAAVVPSLTLYLAVVAAVALLLLHGLRAPGLAHVTDLVVELGDRDPAMLRDTFAKALRDPTLQLGRALIPTGMLRGS